MSEVASSVGHFGEPFFMDRPGGLDDPFADLARYRHGCPVYFHPALDQWFVFRYDNVAALLRDERLSADRMKGFVDQAPEAVRDDLRSIEPLLRSWVLMRDGADHARLRKLINIGFNATAVQALLPCIEQSANTLLDGIEGQDSFDVCADYAFLLPAYVLSDFLGVPAQDRHRIVQWSVDFIDFFNIFPITVESAARMIESTGAMQAYTLALLEERERARREDFLGILLRHAETPDGPTAGEIVGNAMLLLLAGHVAVRNLIGNVVWLLLTRPDEKVKLDVDPMLLRGAIDETLRFEPPVTLIPRIALEPISVCGRSIPAGAVVQLSLAAANRDPAHFLDPDRFDIARQPKQLMSFGHGPHGCAGVNLARLQSEIALRTLLSRHPRLALDPDRPITWYRTAANRGPVNLPLTTAAARS